MQKLLALLLLCLSTLSFAQEDLSQTTWVKNWKPRAKPILNVVLVYYGDHYTEAELARVEALLVKRFPVATGNLLQIKILATRIIPFKNNITAFPDFRLENITDPARLQRLWYYYNVGINVMNESYKQGVAIKEIARVLPDADVYAVVTGAQVDGLGYASGRVIITEDPMEIAWGLSDGGLVEDVSDERVVDELLHELGHTLSFGHASEQCHKDGMDYNAQIECCKTSPNKDDVMSYCRNRRKVTGDFFYGFGECNLKNIREKIVPSMLSGGVWEDSTIEDCE